MSTECIKMDVHGMTSEDETARKKCGPGITSLVPVITGPYAADVIVNCYYYKALFEILLRLLVKRIDACKFLLVAVFPELFQISFC